MHHDGQRGHEAREDVVERLSGESFARGNATDSAASVMIKFQAPTPKLQRNINHQAAIRPERQCLDVEIWSFSGCWSLVLEAFFYEP
jgi:hypothetical protein